MKNKIVFFFLFFVGYNSYCQTNNENLLIGSWSLISIDYNGNKINYEPNSIVVTFSKDRSYTVKNKAKTSYGHWLWSNKKSRESHSIIQIFIKRENLRGLSFETIETISKSTLVLSNEVGSQITYSTYSKYFQNE